MAKKAQKAQIGKKDHDLSKRPIRAINGTKKSQYRPKSPKIGQKVRIQSGLKSWSPIIPLKLLTFFGIPYIGAPTNQVHWFSAALEEKIFFCFVILNYNV